MTKAYQKTIILDDGQNIVSFGAIEVKHDLENKLNESPIAQEQSGQTETLALNLNQINEQFELTAVMDDKVADKLNGSYNNKEEVIDVLLSMFKSQRQISFEYGVSGEAGSREKNGFLQQLSIAEKAENDSTYYRIKARFLVASSMET